MLLGTKPSSVLTHEQNIAWSLSEIIKELENPSLSNAPFPLQVTESQGYYPSEVISVQPVRTVDGGFRHIYRILMPISAASYSGSKAVWDCVGSIAPGMSRVGSVGVIIPGKTDRVRFSPENGIMEYLNGSVWTKVSTGANMRHGWIGGDSNLYVKVADGTYYFFPTANWNATWQPVPEDTFKTQTFDTTAIRL